MLSFFPQLCTNFIGYDIWDITQQDENNSSNQSYYNYFYQQIDFLIITITILLMKCQQYDKNYQYQ
ncbi:hypothetical protein pb186bvf_010514 [Paramecium bursaria]